MAVAAGRLAAIAVVGQQLGLVADADLPHFDPRLKLVGQQADQFAKIDAVLGQVINHHPLAAENPFQIDEGHLQPQPVDVRLADVQFATGLLRGPQHFVIIFGGHGTDDLTFTRRLQRCPHGFGGLHEHDGRFQAAFRADNDPRVTVINGRGGSGKHPHERIAP